MVAAIGSGEAFERGRDFAAWLGLVLRQYSTGGLSILGRISKRGSKYLRTLLIQAAKVLLMRPHNWVRYPLRSTPIGSRSSITVLFA
jgi:transposase